MPRTKFEVSYSGKAARFSDYLDALRFASDASKKSNGALVEVHHSSGIVGQFLNGKPTPEFRAHWNAALGVAA